MWQPESGSQDLVARIWKRGFGSQDMEARIWSRKLLKENIEKEHWGKKTFRIGFVDIKLGNVSVAATRVVDRPFRSGFERVQKYRCI